MARNVTPLLALAMATLLATLALSAAGPATAFAGGCDNRDAKPVKLSHKEARKAVLCLINVQRKQAGIGRLDRDGRLDRAAQRHSNRMRGTGCFSHQCSGEGSLETRLRSVGYLANGLSSWIYGENIAWGMEAQGTPEAVMGLWMNSAGHRANILNPAFRDLGVGFASGSPSSASHPGGIYTTDFGFRRG